MWSFQPSPPIVIAQTGEISRAMITVRPTRLCAILLILSAAIWLAAVNYQVNVAYAVCFWLVGWVGVAALLTWRQLAGLRIELNLLEEVFAGQQARVQLRLQGGAAQRARLFWWRGEYAEQIKEHENQYFTDWRRLKMFSGSLKTLETIWHIPIERRGYFPSDLFVKLATSAPFGLFHAECRVQWQSAAVAYASPLSHQEFGMSPHADETQPAQHANLVQGDDIAYLKPHQAGGSLRNIAWKVYAKRGELMDKVFDTPPAAIRREVISYRDYPQGTPIEKLASLLTYRVLEADKGGVNYTLELPHLTLSPQHGMREKCLNALALM